MLLESLLQTVTTELTTLGWLDSTVHDDPVGTRQHHPLVIVDEYPNDGDDVALNTLAFSYSQATGVDMELGSKSEVHATDCFVDFFAESDAIGREVSGDIYAFLQEERHFDVYDYTLATPVVDFVADIERAEVRKPERAVNPWQKHWYTVALTALDDRTNA
jgi:hypothetical protein